MEILYRIYDGIIMGEGLSFPIVFIIPFIFIYRMQMKRFIDLMKILFTKPVTITKPIISTGRSENNANVNVRKKVIVSKMKKYRQLLLEKTQDEDFNDSQDTSVIINELDELLSIKLKTKEEVELAEYLFNDGKFRTELEKKNMMEKINQINFEENELQYDSLISLMKKEVRQRGVNDAIMSFTLPFIGTSLICPIWFTVIFIKSYITCTCDVSEFGALLTYYPAGYCTSFPIWLGINYLLFGSLNIAAEYDYQKEISSYYEMAGKKPPFNKNIVIQAGLYTLSLGMMFRALRKK